MFDACALPRNCLGRMHVLMLFFMLAVGASGALSIDSPGEAMQDDDDSVWCWLFLAAAISCGCRVSLLARNVSSRGRLSSDPQRYCAWCSGQTFIKIRLLRSIPFICCRLESRETRRRKRLLRSWKIVAAACTAEQDANAAAFARSGVHHLNVRVVVDWHGASWLTGMDITQVVQPPPPRVCHAACAPCVPPHMSMRSRTSAR